MLGSVLEDRYNTREGRERSPRVISKDHFVICGDTVSAT